MTTNRFWLDVLASLRSLWDSGKIQYKEANLNTPLRYSPGFRFQLRQDWLKKDINMVSDFLSCIRVMLPSEELETKYLIKISFIDYYNIKKKISEYLFWRDASAFSEPNPKNSALNILLNWIKRVVQNFINF